MSRQKEIVVRIRRGGQVECLHDESLALEEALQIEEVVKAGNVEFDNHSREWTVDDARTGERLFSHPTDRRVCLEQEHAHYTRKLADGFRPFGEEESP
jgi:hypothetical protein